MTIGSVDDGWQRGGAVGMITFWEIIKIQNSWVVVYFCYIHLQISSNLPNLSKTKNLESCNKFT